MADMSTASINDLPDSEFAYIEPGGSKDDSGKTIPRSLRHLPIHDATHVRDALSRMSQDPFGEKGRPKIMSAAKKFGINVQQQDASRAETGVAWPTVITRAYSLDELNVVSDKMTCERCGRDATGRMVEAYAAVFDSPSEIRDDHGHYMETIDRSAFNRTINNGFKTVGVFYNHGRTIYGTPSELGSYSLGHPSVIRADGRGLLTMTHYGTSDVADRVLTQLKDGDITGHSFTGRIIRSDPDKMPRVHRGDELLRVKRVELGLQEYGPTPIPAYHEAELVAVRSEPASDQHSTGPVGTGSSAGDSPSTHSERQEEIAARIRAARESRGWRE